MKHLISPLDLSVDELDHILALGQSIMLIRKHMHMYATAKN